jgi:hypothetical protein
MPFVRFSRHALERMGRWNLAADDVTATVCAPDHLRRDRQDRLHAGRRRRGDWLSVVYAERDGLAVIVTVALRRRRSVADG